MAYPHCCTCTDSPIMGTGSNMVNRQLAFFDSCQWYTVQVLLVADQHIWVIQKSNQEKLNIFHILSSNLLFFFIKRQYHLSGMYLTAQL